MTYPVPVVTGPLPRHCGCTVQEQALATQYLLPVLSHNAQILASLAAGLIPQCERRSLGSRIPIEYVASSSGRFDDYPGELRTNDHRVLKFLVPREYLRDPEFVKSLHQNMPNVDHEEPEDLPLYFEKTFEICDPRRHEYDKTSVLIDTAACRSVITRKQAICYGFPEDRQLLKPGAEGYGLRTIYCACGEPLPNFGSMTVKLACPHPSGHMQLMNLSMLVVPDDAVEEVWPSIILGQDAIYRHGLLSLL